MLQTIVKSEIFFCPPILTLCGALLPPLRRHAVGFADHVSKLCVVSLQCPSIHRNHGLNECKMWFQGLSQPYKFSTKSATGVNDFRFLGLMFSVYKTQTLASAPSTNLGGPIWGQASMTLATGVHLTWSQGSGKTAIPPFFP